MNRSRSSIRTFCAGLVFAALATGAWGQGSRMSLVVHVPSSPIEGAARQAAATETLARLLSKEVAGLDLEARLFRRLADAQAYLDASPERSVLVMTDAAWVPDLSSRGLAPAFRMRRGGVETYRRLLVVPADSESQTLSDLRGKTLAIVETAPSNEPYLQHAVFSGEISISEWFSMVGTEVDDFAAVNATLFGTRDAALAAEYNPLLAANLGRELRVIYRSPPLPLPVISWRTGGPGALDAETRGAISGVMTSLTDTSEGQALLADLGIDGITSMDAAQAGRLARLHQDTVVKEFEITAPRGQVLQLEPPAPPQAGALTFRLAIELPKVDVESGDN